MNLVTVMLQVELHSYERCRTTEIKRRGVVKLLCPLKQIIYRSSIAVNFPKRLAIL